MSVLSTTPEHPCAPLQACQRHWTEGGALRKVDAAVRKRASTRRARPPRTADESAVPLRRPRSRAPARSKSAHVPHGVTAAAGAAPPPRAAVSSVNGSVATSSGAAQISWVVDGLHPTLGCAVKPAARSGHLPAAGGARSGGTDVQHSTGVSMQQYSTGPSVRVSSRCAPYDMVRAHTALSSIRMLLFSC
jgi:hypothetical protein